ncbi:MAG TPA: hypothetical protein VGC62_15595 [Pseudomonas sp.]|uniref:hypothetical protein n=1 Tax=Pseudomonas sp. TaxID=306 RepID=UPI002ED9FA8B
MNPAGCLQGPDGKERQRIWSYFSTMDAQRALFTAQQQWLTLELARVVNLANRYKALGGWTPPP